MFSPLVVSMVIVADVIDDFMFSTIAIIVNTIRDVVLNLTT
jgi:hypothetical protein